MYIECIGDDLMNELVISIKNAYKKFGEQVVLNDVSLEIYKGRIYGIIGRNGSGKTVLFKSICGFILLDSGEITVSDKVIGKDVDMPKNDDIKNAIRRVGLNPEDKKAVGKYSLGMRQRLGIAQAIMENPDILVLDEPFNGLDKKGVTEMRSLLLQMKDEGKTIIMASHSSEDIDILCDEVYEMEAGKIVRE